MTATVRPSAPAPASAKPVATPVLAPATRQHAAPRKPVTPAAVAATSSTSQADKDTLENVIELVRKRKAGDASSYADSISDPVARKLAEWIILRSEDNGASVERYRAFLSANPSWPSQTFLRRRLEAAMWDDRRDDSVGWSWFENESPVSAKGRFVLAKAMLARGDRANAERLVREAWRSDPMSEDTENNALDQFGALLTPGDQKARMDTLLYGSETEAALRAAKRLGAGYVALAKARIASFKKAPNTRALLEEVPRELHSDPGFIFSKIQLLRREEKFAEAAQLMLSAPKDPNRLYNLDEWWIERRLLARKMIDTEEFRSAYLIARDAALPRATSTRPSRNSRRAGSRCASSTIPRQPPSTLPASASAASIRPRWRVPVTGRAAPRKPQAASRRRATPMPALPSNRRAITASSRAQNSACRRSS